MKNTDITANATLSNGIAVINTGMSISNRFVLAADVRKHTNTMMYMPYPALYNGYWYVVLPDLQTAKDNVKVTVYYYEL